MPNKFGNTWMFKGVLGEICKILWGGVEGGKTKRWLLCDGPGESCGDGWWEHHLCRCNSWFHSQWWIRRCKAPKRSLDQEEHWNRVSICIYNIFIRIITNNLLSATIL